MIAASAKAGEANPSPENDGLMHKKAPCRGRELLVFAVCDLRLADGVDVTGEVEHLVGEAPFIVIPCNELYEVAVEDRKSVV